MDEIENERKRKKRELIKMLGLLNTLDILRFLCKNEGNYAQLRQFVDTNTLNTRLRKLVEYGLIEHHFKRNKTRKEWYTITEKGRRVTELGGLLEDEVN